MSKLHFKLHFFPGKNYSDKELVELVADLRQVANSCQLEDINYQALTGEREELSRAAIIGAYDINDNMVAFCSSLRLPVADVGDVLHLGLTCVAPSSRGMGLTHKLSSKLLFNYLLRYSPFGDVWITNCACVISSLGNVAMYFEDLYPSPFNVKGPSRTHIKIAHAINEQYRKPIAINENARFNYRKFIFERSVEGTSFQKDASDFRFYHRNQAMTDYYQSIINFERGDEVLQIGRCSFLTFPKYLMRNTKNKFSLKVRKVEEYAS